MVLLISFPCCTNGAWCVINKTELGDTGNPVSLCKLMPGCLLMAVGALPCRAQAAPSESEVGQVEWDSSLPH